MKRYLELKKNDDPYAYFYLLAKIHKNPIATRPIVSVSGSILYALSKWVKFIPYRIQSSSELVGELKQLGRIQPVYFFSSDAEEF